MNKIHLATQPAKDEKPGGTPAKAKPEAKAPGKPSGKSPPKTEKTASPDAEAAAQKRGPLAEGLRRLFGSKSD